MLQVPRAWSRWVVGILPVCKTHTYVQTYEDALRVPQDLFPATLSVWQLHQVKMCLLRDWFLYGV